MCHFIIFYCFCDVFYASLQFLRNLDDEIQTVRFEEECLRRRLEETTTHQRIANGHMTAVELKLMLDETQKERLVLGLTTIFTDKLSIF